MNPLLSMNCIFVLFCVLNLLYSVAGQGFNGTQVSGASCVGNGLEFSCTLVGYPATVKCLGLTAHYGKLGVPASHINDHSIGRDADSTRLIEATTLSTDGSVVTQMTLGQVAVCFLFDNGKIKCTGTVWAGPVLAASSLTTYATFGTTDPAIAISSQAGQNQHACALFQNGRVRCWGANKWGKVGLPAGTTEIGYSAAEMLSIPFVDFGDTTPIISVAAGIHHTICLFANHKIKGFGSGWFGELGGDVQRDIMHGTIATQPYIAIGAAPADVRVLQVAIGSSYTCVLDQNGGVMCFGSNTAAQLGFGSTKDLGNGLNPNHMMSDLRPIVFSDTMPAVQIGAHGHSCAVFVNGRARCWGSNSNGAIGTQQGGTEVIGDTPGEMSTLDYISFGRDIDSIGISRAGVGSGQTCFVFANGDFRCIGSNGSGQLGLNARHSLGSEPGSMCLSKAIDFSDPGTALCKSDSYRRESIDDPEIKIPPCPFGHVWDYDTESCSVCHSGTYYDFSNSSHPACSPCPKGTYHNHTGGAHLEDCQECPPGSFSTGGASECTLCPEGTYGPGARLSECVPCGLNHWGNKTGAVNDLGDGCSACPPFAVTETEISTSIDECECLSHQTLVNYEVGCTCEAGHFLAHENSCRECQPGEYKSGLGRVSCSVCPSTTRVPPSKRPGTSIQDCQCEHRSNTELVSGTCVCKAGYEYDATSDLCRPCSLVEYKGTAANSDCLACPPTALVATNNAPGTRREDCVCPSNSRLPANGTFCECAPGYHPGGPVDGGCTACANDHYKSQWGRQACSRCPRHSSVPTNSTPGVELGACKCLPDMVLVNPGDVSCVCIAGYYWSTSASTCLPCSPNTYKPTAGDDACTLCPRFATVSLAKLPGVSLDDCVCPSRSVLHRHNGTNTFECMCVPGYTRDLLSGACIPCPSDTFKSTIGDGACTPCPHGASVPSQLVPGTNSSVCLCPSTTVLTTRNGLPECECRPSYGRRVKTEPCERCPAQKFKNATGNFDCTFCPANSLSLDGLECTCVEGHFPESASQTFTSTLNCVPCPTGGSCTGGALKASAGFWRSGTDADTLLECPDNTCLGGGECRDGHRGLVCASCKPGWEKNLLRKCVPCNKPNWLLIFLAYIPFLFVALWILDNFASRRRQSTYRIVLQHLQYLSLLQLEPDITVYLSLFQFDVYSFFASWCLFTGGYSTRWAIRIATPVILLVLYVPFYGTIALYRNLRRNQPASPPAPLKARMVRTLFHIVIWTSLLVLRLIGEVFFCRDVGGTLYLAADLQLVCWGDTHVRIVITAIVIGLFYVVPVCVTLGMLLLSQRNMPGALRFVDLSFLRDLYTEESDWWELVYLFRRVLVAVVISMSDVPSVWRAFLLLVILHFAHYVHALRQPCKTIGTNRLEDLSLQLLMLSFLLEFAALALSDIGQRSTSLGLVILVLAVNGALMVLAIYRGLRKWTRKIAGYGGIMAQHRSRKADSDSDDSPTPSRRSGGSTAGSSRSSIPVSKRPSGVRFSEATRGSTAEPTPETMSALEMYVLKYDSDEDGSDSSEPAPSKANAKGGVLATNFATPRDVQVTLDPEVVTASTYSSTDEDEEGDTSAGGSEAPPALVRKLSQVLIKHEGDVKAKDDTTPAAQPASTEVTTEAKGATETPPTEVPVGNNVTTERPRALSQ